MQVAPVNFLQIGGADKVGQAAARGLQTNLERAAAGGSRRAQRELAEWNALSKAKQTKIGTVISSEGFALAVATMETDPAKLGNISSALVVDENSGTLSTRRKTVAGPVQRTVYYDVTSWWKYTYSVYGVAITSVKQTYDYQTNASTVTASYACRGTSTNWAPTRSISVISVDHWKSSGKGYCNIAWRLSYAIGWVPTPLHNDFTQKMRVNGSSGIESTTFVD